MWVLHKEMSGLLWLELEYHDVGHFILPIFTDPDSAMEFVGELDHEGEAIIMQHVDSTEELAELIIAINTQPASAVMLNPPHPDAITSEDGFTYWVATEFSNIASTLIMMSDSYDDKLIIDILNRYLHNKLDYRATKP